MPGVLIQCVLATAYLHWYQRLFSPGLWGPLLSLGAIVFMALRLWATFPRRRSFFSPLLFLSFLPWLSCSWLVAARTYDWRYVLNADVIIASNVQTQRFGILATVSLLALYSLVHLASRWRAVRRSATAS